MASPELQTADNSLLTNILKEAVFTQQEKSIVNQVFTVYNMQGTPGLTAQIPVYPSIAAQAPGQTAEIADTAVALTNVDITASEVGARIDVSDLLAEATARNMGSDVGQLIGSAIAEKVDTDAFALFAEGTADSASAVMADVGDNATAITPELLLQAVYKLREANAPTDAAGDYHCVLHPGQAYNVVKTLTANGAIALSNKGNELLSTSAYVGRLFNIKIFQSTAIAADSVATDANGCVFSPMAFGHVLKRPLRIETQRDASKRSTEYVGSTAVASKLIKASYGIIVKGSKAIA